MLAQNYIETPNFQPKASELQKAELVVNLTDRVIYTKDQNGDVISVGGGGGGDITCTVPVLKKDMVVEAGSRCMMVSPTIPDDKTLTIEDDAVLVIL